MLNYNCIFLSLILCFYSLKAIQPEHIEDPIIQQLINLNTMQEQVLHALQERNQEQRAQGVITQGIITRQLTAHIRQVTSISNLTDEHILAAFDLEANKAFLQDPVIRQLILSNSILKQQVIYLQNENVSNRAIYEQKLNEMQATYTSDTAVTKQNNIILRDQIGKFKTHIAKLEEQMNIRDNTIKTLKAWLKSQEENEPPS